MGIRRLVVPAAVLALAMSIPAHAEQRRGGNRGGSRAEGGRVESRGAAPRAESRGAAPRVESRTAAPRGGEYRGEYRGGYGGVYRREAPRVYSSRGYGYSRPYYYRYSRPYYTFRPRLSLGFGLWIGDPVPYPVYGYYPYGYDYPYPEYPQYPAQYPQYPDQYPQYPASQYPDAYPTQPGNTVSPSSVGGVSFEISPSNASVYVDGQYAGIVGDFSPTSQPLSLTPGRHHVELSADGYTPLTFDVDVVAGQVIPYRGSLRQ